MQTKPLPHIYTVTELTLRVKDQLEQEFVNLWLEGEVSNLRMPPSGHIYFTLKDEYSQIRAIIFKNKLRYLKFSLKDGMQILVKGSLTVYERRGEYQVVAEYVEPKGIGALQLAYEELKSRLAAEGLFDEAHKKPIPLLPRTIGLVTSPTGAAIRDILNIIDRRFPNVRIIINPVRVQGEGAALEIAQAIEELNQLAAEIDILILARGGGSLEDLWCFNEEVVARAIYASCIPIISAVGHEIDYTIADFVADVRAPTPSAAAELVVENKEALRDKLYSLWTRLHQGMKHILDSYRNRLQLALQSRAFTDPSRRIMEYQQRLDDLYGAMQKGIAYNLLHIKHRLDYLQQALMNQKPSQQITHLRHQLTKYKEKLHLVYHYLIQTRRSQLTTLMGRLDALSPLSILGRGYSICRKLPGLEIIRDAKEVQIEDEVSVKLHQGGLVCQVRQVKEHQLF